MRGSASCAPAKWPWTPTPYGPNAFVDGWSDNAHGEAGPHQRWATEILWDNITVNGGNNDIQNAGNYGTGHGWEAGNSLIWNNKANGFIVQNPPGARNWLIGSVGPIQTGTAWDVGREYVGKGASGYGVRLLVELARRHAERG